MNAFIGADHEFHDKDFVTGWADRFRPTPERLALFNLILSELNPHSSPSGCIVELGIGPGYLAKHLLQAIPDIHYYGIDFSQPMLEIARKRLNPYADRVSYIRADLVKDNWWSEIDSPISAIVSTWALHDLGSKENTTIVYKNCAQLLQHGGIFLNGDFIKPDKTIHEYEKGRFEIAKHIQLMHDVGLTNAECLVVFEEEIESPTAAQNYACLKASI